MPVSASRDLVANYRYFLYDLISGEFLAEIPFKGVSYARSLREAGQFSGSISVIDATFNLSLYENTLPGKTALYILRNDTCVWGGIIWSRTYNIIEKTLDVTASEFTSYLYHRVVWKTWSNDYEASAVVSSGKVNVTLTFAEFNFEVGMPVYLDFGDEKVLYNGYYTVISSPAPTSSTFSVTAQYVNAKGQTKTIPAQSFEVITVEVRQDTYKYARDLLTELATDLADFEFPNEAIEPGVDLFNEIESFSRSNNVATLVLAEPHGIVVGQRISVTDLSGYTTESAIVTEVPDDNTIRFASTGANGSGTAVSNEKTIEFFQRTNSIITITTSTAHGFPVGAIVFIEDLNTSIDGFHTVYATGPTSADFQIVVGGDTIALSPAAETATATVAPAVNSASYGEFTLNSDIDIEYSTNGNSGKSQRNQIIRGFELRTVGEILEEYSNVPNGFEYRIDCSYDPGQNKFIKTFVFLPLIPESLQSYLDSLGGSLPTGEFAPVSAFGADQIVFEYPGNVLGATLEESAEDAATRFWIQGNDENLSAEASQPYSAASDTDFLSRGWPILDQVESIDQFSDEGILYDFATRYLEESKPPISAFSISVNGSFTPEVGTYKPGDWCSVIINDDFVRLRLTSYIELSDGVGRDVLLRKIESFSVTVPDNPSFPEEVELQLVTEPGVDKVGD
jgi:hypothetical protein